MVRRHIDSACVRLYEKTFDKVWKKYVIGAGGGATAWKVVEKLIALHFPTTTDKLFAWLTLFVVIISMFVMNRHGKLLFSDE